MLEVSVCIGSSCHLRGSYNIVQVLQQEIEENELHEKINLKANFCMKQCRKEGVSVMVNDELYNIPPENARTFFKDVILKA